MKLMPEGIWFDYWILGLLDGFLVFAFASSLVERNYFLSLATIGVFLMLYVSHVETINRKIKNKVGFFKI